jgi:transcriptional regulator with XRE-family HTH domain
MAREQRGISQLDVAHAVGLSRSAVANVESGRQRLPIHALIAACQALGIDPADVITRTLEGADPLASVLSPGATQHTARLRRQLLTAQGHISNLLAELPQEQP